MSDDPNRIPDEEVDRLLSEQRRARIVHQRNIVLIAGSALVVLLLVSLVIVVAYNRILARLSGEQGLA